LICNHQVVSSTLTGGSIFKALSIKRLGLFCVRIPRSQKWSVSMNSLFFSHSQQTGYTRRWIT